MTTDRHREQAREIVQTCFGNKCCAQCCLNPQHEHYRKRGGFICACCGREVKLRINGKLCNKCATGHASRDTEVREVLERLAWQLDLSDTVEMHWGHPVEANCTPACLTTRALWEKVQPQD